MQISLSDARTAPQEIRAWRQQRQQEAALLRSTGAGPSFSQALQFVPGTGTAAPASPAAGAARELPGGLAALLARLDTDDDGRITAQEFAAASRMRAAPDQARPEPEGEEEWRPERTQEGPSLPTDGAGPYKRAARA